MHAVAAAPVVLPAHPTAWLCCVRDLSADFFAWPSSPVIPTQGVSAAGRAAAMAALGPGAVVVVEGASIPDHTRCRAAHAPDSVAGQGQVGAWRGVVVAGVNGAAAHTAAQPPDQPRAGGIGVGPQTMGANP